MASERRQQQSKDYFASKAGNVVTDPRPAEIVPLGTRTQWGTVRAIFSGDGKTRDYFCVDPRGGIALIPGDEMERSHTFGRKRNTRKKR